jgi:Glucose-6-phosphate dehydrogenase, C-terminal domain
LGDATLFARQDYVEEAWRIVDPLLKAATPIYEYEKATWGPTEVDQRVLPAGGWHNPVASDHEDVGVDRTATRAPMKLNSFDDADAVARNGRTTCEWGSPLTTVVLR